MSTSHQLEQLGKILATAADSSRRILLSGAHVITMDNQGEFLGTSSSWEITSRRPAKVSRSQVGDDAIVVDLAGSIVIPGLVDSHIHAWALGRVSYAASLRTQRLENTWP